MSSEHMSEVYKEFGRDTEAGRLLHTLYGKRSAPVKITLKNAPARRIDPHAEHQAKIRARADQVSYDKRSYVAPLPVPAQRSRPGPVYNRPMRKPQSVIQQELRQSDAEHKANVRSNRGKYTSRETQIKNLQNSTYQKGKKKVAPKKLRQQPANENVYRPEEVRFAEVNDQINERRAYIDEMRYLGELSPEDERRLNGEIADRVSELNRLHVQLRN